MTQVPEKLDLKQECRELYRAGKTVTEVRAGRGVFLAVDGVGAPGGDAFQSAAERLYSLAYTLKFMLKMEGKLDFTPCHLEALWFDDPAEKPVTEWHWRLLMRIPQQVTARDVTRARKQLLESKGLDTTDVTRVSWTEGRAVQVMHVGPYDQVCGAYAALGACAAEAALVWAGPAHEIYMNDPRRTAPAKLKTIVRRAVKAGPRKAARG